MGKEEILEKANRLFRVRKESNYVPRKRSQVLINREAESSGKAAK
jgi:hypothetical protein